MSALFRIDQVSSGQGTVDSTRTDLVPGEVITLIVPNPVAGAIYTWEILYKYGSSADLVSTTGSTAMIGPDVAIGPFCLFLIKLTETVGRVTTVRKRIAAVRSVNKGLRPLAFGETASSTSTRAQHSSNYSTDNEYRANLDGVSGESGQVWAGWITTLNEMLATLDTAGGSGGDAAYTHLQGPASSTWVVTHNLGKNPSVTVVDSLNDLCLGNVHYDSPNQVTITFSAPFSGKAFCN